MIHLFRHYQDGRLAVDGGITRQPKFYTEMMAAIEKEMIFHAKRSGSED